MRRECFPNQGNPNTIAPVTQTWRIPPLSRKDGYAPPKMATFGITLDGIKLERDTAESYLNERRWSYEALTPGLAQSIERQCAVLNGWVTDCNNAHVSTNGCFTTTTACRTVWSMKLASEAEGQDMNIGRVMPPMVFPFYVDLGHNSPEGSWELRSGTRESAPRRSFRRHVSGRLAICRGIGRSRSV